MLWICTLKYVLTFCVTCEANRVLMAVAQRAQTFPISLAHLTVSGHLHPCFAFRGRLSRTRRCGKACCLFSARACLQFVQHELCVLEHEEQTFSMWHVRKCGSSVETLDVVQLVGVFSRPMSVDPLHGLMTAQQ